VIRIHTPTAPAVAAAIAVLALVGCSGPAPQPDGRGSETVSNHGTVSVTWAQDMDDALERARAENKAVVVNFYADWCVWCQRMESTTLRDANVASLLSEQVVPVNLDVDGDGKELSNDFGVEALPTVLVLDTEGREIGRIPGYMPPAGFLEALEGFLRQG
jgi:thiol:disulfide interchange protein